MTIVDREMARIRQSLSSADVLELFRERFGCSAYEARFQLALLTGIDPSDTEIISEDEEAALIEARAEEYRLAGLEAPELNWPYKAQT